MTKKLATPKRHQYKTPGIPAPVHETFYENSMDFQNPSLKYCSFHLSDSQKATGRTPERLISMVAAGLIEHVRIAREICTIDVSQLCNLRSNFNGWPGDLDKVTPAPLVLRPDEVTDLRRVARTGSASCRGKRSGEWFLLEPDAYQDLYDCARGKTSSEPLPKNAVIGIC